MYIQDSTFDFNGYHIIIEVKGYPNDTYPFKRKIFLTNLGKGLYNIQQPVVFMEIHSTKELIQAIEIIKTLP